MKAKITETQKLLKKHSTRLWKAIKRWKGDYMNGENGIVYTCAVQELEDVPEFPLSSTDKEPMIVVTLHEHLSKRVIPILASRKAMDSVYELDQVEQAYEDFLHYTGYRPSPKFYNMIEEIKGIFKITEEDEEL